MPQTAVPPGLRRDQSYSNVDLELTTWAPSLSNFLIFISVSSVGLTFGLPRKNALNKPAIELRNGGSEHHCIKKTGRVVAGLVEVVDGEAGLRLRIAICTLSSGSQATVQSQRDRSLSELILESTP